ncbi:MAG: hypothetical protein LLG24_06675 [Actinomycetia bacterium]|nr:hypothetical protein [Actinomycetes bacterium]
MIGLAHMGGRMMGGYGYGPDGFGDGSLFAFGHLLFGLFVLAVVIGVIVWAVGHSKRAQSVHGATTYPAPSDAAAAAPADDAALKIARERLARGEIDVEQYSAIEQALRG